MPVIEGPWPAAEVLSRHVEQRANVSNKEREKLCDAMVHKKLIKILSATALLAICTLTGNAKGQARGTCGRLTGVQEHTSAEGIPADEFMSTMGLFRLAWYCGTPHGSGGDWASMPTRRPEAPGPWDDRPSG
jgi:hypothetical protein